MAQTQTIRTACPPLLVLVLLFGASCGGDPVLVLPNKTLDVDSALPAEFCPEIVDLQASPLEAGIGDAIMLEAEAVDPDGDEISYHWRGSGGFIREPREPSTSFVCKTRGPGSVRLTVSDAGGCDRGEEFSVSCR
jgi:hypothetical protein